MTAAYDELLARANEVWQAVERPARPLVRVQVSTCTIAAGALETLEALRREAADRALEVDIETAGELGLCWVEPLVEVRKPDSSALLYAKVTADQAGKLLEQALDGVCKDLAFAVLDGEDVAGVPRLEALDYWAIQDRRLIARCGVIDPENIDHYIAAGGYKGLDKALAWAPGEVIGALGESTLKGRSGSNFPTGRKWDFLRGKTRAPKYLLCNADEGDPGAFVNRIVMESDPHTVVEGMLIAAHVTGASEGIVYIRDEYPLAIERMEKAVAQARERGLLGAGVLGSGLSFELRIWRGAGSYVCGEESGLISSLDDARGMPRVRPPFPADVGVFGQPSNVNNIETFASVALLLQRGLEFYTSVGTEQNRGTKIWSFSGHIERVGLMELPFGIELRRVYEVLEPSPWQERRPLKAVQSGGPLTGILPAHLALRLTLEPESFRELDCIMGGGGVVFIDDSACIVDLNIMFSWFLEDESCGRCTTCHGGTQRMTEVFRRIARGGGQTSDYDKMAILADMLQWSNCVHGSAAPTIMARSADLFREEIDEHIVEHRCRAKVCPELIRYEVQAKSEQMAEAQAICPVDAIEQDEENSELAAVGGWSINERCIKCDACREIAPEAIAVVDAQRVTPAAPSRAHLQSVGRDARGRMN